MNLIGIDFPEESSWIRRKAVEDLHFLDSLLPMEIAEDDIAFLVAEVAEKCTTEFVPWLALRNREVSVPAIASFLRELFIFTYLTNGTPQSKIGRLSRQRLRQYLLCYEKDSPHGWAELAAPHELLALFFRFLSEKGYILPLGRFCNSLKALEKEQNKRKSPESS